MPKIYEPEDANDHNLETRGKTIRFCGVVAGLFALTLALESTASDFSDYTLWAVAQLAQPAVMVRRWLFEIPGAELDHHYYSVLGPFDYVGLLIGYFLVCLTLAWYWIRNKSGNAK